MKVLDFNKQEDKDNSKEMLEEAMKDIDNYNTVVLIRAHDEDGKISLTHNRHLAYTNLLLDHAKMILLGD